MARKHYYENYGSVTDMLETAEARWSAYHSHKDSRHTNNASFYGDETYSEARELLLNGWRDGAEAILKGVRALEQGYSTPPQGYGVAGYAPNVGLYCAGSPAHMLRNGAQHGRKKVLRFAFNTGASAAITRDEKYNFGIALLTVINALEARGFSLELTAYKKTTLASGSLTVATRIKNAGEQLDAERVAFVCAHAAYQRRFMFALLESKPEYKFLCDQAYGFSGNVTAADAGGDAYILEGLSQRVNASYCSTPENAARWLVETTNKLIGSEVLDLSELIN